MCFLIVCEKTKYPTAYTPTHTIQQHSGIHNTILHVVIFLNDWHPIHPSSIFPSSLTRGSVSIWKTIVRGRHNTRCQWLMNDTGSENCLHRPTAAIVYFKFVRIRDLHRFTQNKLECVERMLWHMTHWCMYECTMYVSLNRPICMPYLPIYLFND